MLPESPTDEAPGPKLAAAIDSEGAATDAASITVPVPFFSLTAWNFVAVADSVVKYSMTPLLVTVRLLVLES